MSKRSAHILIGLVCLIVLMACGNKIRRQDGSKRSKAQNTSAISDSVRIVQIGDSMERRRELEPFFADVHLFEKQDTLSSKLCDWYCLKTVDYLDSGMNCAIYIDFPSMDSWSVNTTIKKEISKEKANLFHSIQSNREKYGQHPLPNDFQARLISAYTDSLYISFTYAISTYEVGAPHPMQKLISLNFDKRSNRRITFSNYFHVETSEDSLLLLDLIRSYQGTSETHLNTIYEFDFNLQKDYVTLNFDAYEIASYAYGTPRVPLNRAMVEKRFGS